MSSLDLHIHSAISSDGEFPPAVLIEMAQKSGVSMLSITDHNSVRGVREAQAAADRAGLRLISGIEIDCLFQDLNLHVLGYGIDIDDPAFAEIERHATEQEKNAFPTMIRKLQELDFQVLEEDVRNNTNAPIPVAEDIAEVMLADDACNEDRRLDPYRRGGEKSDMPFVHFYYDWCAKGKPAYAPKNFTSLETVINIIKTAGGIPVLAHPGPSLPDSGTQLPEIIAAGIEGIEVFSSYHSEEETQTFLDVAKKCNLLITCGSDFHGKNKPKIKLGSTDCGGVENKMIESLVGFLPSGTTGTKF